MGHPVACKTCRDNKALKSGGRPTKRISYDLDEHYDTHEEFIGALSSFLEQHDDNKFDLAAESLKIRAALTANILIETDVSFAICAQLVTGLCRHESQCCSGMTFSTAQVTFSHGESVQMASIVQLS
ncbi:hypothetical protein V1525DRAFT_405034 [Lipomyces kononenkoae]|uniref:Uncharacterized protein n=1 Tax=Lipomyces kononenkoae TaxID=34357 RepID=A0ACC3SZV7_LIPKO